VAFEVYTHDALGEIRIKEGSRASPKKIHFCHKLTDGQTQHYQSFYGCELKGLQTSYSLFFDAQSLNLPSQSSASYAVI